ncbi:MAG: FecR domain-containing protein [Candidatus Eisenbacteria bacterium]
MSDDYLWDKTGQPDPEVAKLERVLGTLGHRGEPLELSETLAPLAGVPTRAWAAAAGVLVVAGAVALWFATHRAPGWEVARLEGAPRVGTSRIAAAGRLVVGEWLETDASSRARVSVGRIGEVLVEPNTRLRLLEAGDQQQRLHLALGTVTALILAPPRQFVVETPSARAVDLGCAYTLEVDALGGALITVLAGWVSFEYQGRESFIPAGGRCATRAGIGPGTPYFTDASHAFKNALAMLDVADDEAAHGAALSRVLAEARREDALTLWHLLARLRGIDRDQVYARLAALVPPPAGVTREGVMAGDQGMLERWWNELGFGEMKWWRLWQRGWPQPGAGQVPGSGGPS